MSTAPTASSDSSTTSPQKSAETSGRVIDNFSLQSAAGTVESLTSNTEGEVYVVCFLGTECPLARLYGPRLIDLTKRFKDQAVRFLSINSNPQDSLDELRAFTDNYTPGIIALKDFDQSVAKAFGATRTPEVFVLDRHRTVRYQGRIDNQYQPGIARPEPTTHELRDAIVSLLAGEGIATPLTDAVGCRITMNRAVVSESTVTYCDQISRILQKHCMECHRSGEIGPFALTDFNEITGWGEMMLEVVDQGRMPPWHADSQHASFANARQMSEEEKTHLHQWVESGMPYGDARKLPNPQEFPSGWRFSEPPHQVLEMASRPFSVPAEGIVEYQYFVVDPQCTEDRWVRAAQVIPGDASVVHHCIAFIRPPDGDSFRDIGLLSAYVPGQINNMLPEGYARRIPAGSKIVFQMHYTPNGKETKDLTKVGLWFTDEAAVTHEVYALGGVNHEFEIPPHIADFPVRGKVSWHPRKGELLAITPHMHVRGKAFELSVRTTDSQEQVLLKVPHYDFNWQHTYELTEPLSLQAIEEISFTSVFDNSAQNPTNPDPSECVMWGDQTWKEMALVFLEVAEPRGTSQRSLIAKATNAETSTGDSKQQKAAQQKAFVDSFFDRFDLNGDGRISRAETPTTFGIFAFREIDANRDDTLDREEVSQAAAGRFQ